MNKPQLHLAAEALAPQPPIIEVVQGLISEGSVSVIAGEGGDGKTWSLLDLGVCVAAGDSWLQTRKTIQGNVLFVDEESGLTRFNLRLQKVMNGHGVDASLPFFYTSLSLFNLMKKADLQELENLIGGYSIKLTVIDAFMDVTPGADENAVKDIAPVMQGLRRIAEKTKCAIMIIHHNNKAGSYRGSTAIKGAVDNLISVKKTGDVVTFRSEKVRDTEPFEFSAKMHFETDKFTMGSTQQIKFGIAQEYVIRFIGKNGNSAMSDIKANAVGCQPDAARVAITGLVKLGFLMRTNPGGPGAEGFYDLTDDGKLIALERNWPLNDPWFAADHANL